MTDSERQRKYRAAHPQKINEYQKEYYHRHRGVILHQRAELRKREGMPEKEYARVRAWLSEHPDSLKKKMKYDWAHRSATARVASAIRRRIRIFIKKETRSCTTEELLGCTWNKVKEYIESQFAEGMTWENHGEWHIDHKAPCASFDLLNIEDQKKCFHYSNLQPLWAKDNIKKGSTITDGFGNFWSLRCPMCNKNKMQIVRPGKVQCSQCG